MLDDQGDLRREARQEAARRFAGELRELREAAGQPSLRQMAARSGRISHTTLHDCLSGARLPSWEATREFVRACGGNEEEWQARWSAASTAPSPDESVVTDETASVVPDSAEVATPPTRPRRRRRLFVLLATGAAAAIAAVVFLIPNSQNTSANTSSSPTTDVPGPLVPDDRSRFIGDLTIPDGTVVSPGTRFTKIWEIENSGLAIWRGRYLEREDLPVTPDTCQTPERIAIGDTLPNDRVKISVDVTAPKTPTTCMVKWKMVDSAGRRFFPSARPVYFLVYVRG
ncbi:NBR1-Ig-like domain-containing protein [Actinokineospora inagensis]|uniref:NBR1-Ig-like domain-containing protein n=1 Tax=Actinokineospora inagensis TaxID=103730 RepID=UPI0003F99D20|nr:NBR1-Ig-like domain-containing protein [Actinokineospora inagensis]